MTEKEFILTMAGQIPNPYTRGRWYDSELPNGQKCEIKKTAGRGRSSGVLYLHIRKPVKIRIVSPDGTPLRQTGSTDFLYFRANLSTYKLKEY